tara:strand:- start:397 stop:864 length:468 start_codon:yes stop_codon:yes gene_type:complete
MNESKNKVDLNFYNIKTDFNYVMLNLCNGLLKNSEKTLINLKDNDEVNTLDRFLWTKEKNSFLPHKISTDKITDKDNIIIFEGDFKNINNFLDFDFLVVSPNVKIKQFKFFKKFLIFSYESSNYDLIKIKDELENKDFKVTCYNEYERLKWKTLN